MDACYFFITFFVQKTAKKLAGTIIKNDVPVKLTLVLPTITVSIMVPLMSFCATAFIIGFTSEFEALYAQAVLRNYPVAWMCQVLLAGPLMRHLFFPQRASNRFSIRLSYKYFYNQQH